MKYIYSVYFYPTTATVYLNKRPTKKQLERIARKYGWLTWDNDGHELFCLKEYAVTKLLLLDVKEFHG